jgi:hypothetical protein
MALQTCRVTCRDLNGIEHTVAVTADSRDEVVAHGFRAFQEGDWAADIGRSNTMIIVIVKQREAEHKVRVRDVEAWLESVGQTPAEASPFVACQLTRSNATITYSIKLMSQ